MKDDICITAFAPGQRHVATLLVVPPGMAEISADTGTLIGEVATRETELAAMRAVIDYERARGWEPVDISHIHGPGFDIRSLARQTRPPTCARFAASK